MGLCIIDCLHRPLQLSSSSATSSATTTSSTMGKKHERVVAEAVDAKVCVNNVDHCGWWDRVLTMPIIVVGWMEWNTESKYMVM